MFVVHVVFPPVRCSILALAVCFSYRGVPPRTVWPAFYAPAMLLLSVYYFRGAGCGGMVMSCLFRGRLDFPTVLVLVVGGAL